MERTAWEAFHGLLPGIIREKYCVVLETWEARQDLAPLWEFLRRQTEKTWEKRIVCPEGRR